MEAEISVRLFRRGGRGEVFQAEGTTAKVKRKKDYSFFQKLKEMQYGWNAVCLGLISSSRGK